jgi:uncharacterized protein (TIGR03437 family)
MCSRLLFLVAFFYALTSGGANAQVNVLTANYDNYRTNANPHETLLKPSNVNALSFGKLFALPVDGAVNAQPLYISSLSVSGATHNVLIVATHHNSVYAFDADVPGPALWQTNLGPTVPSTDYHPLYTDIVPEVGILSTPTIDLASGTVYVVADVKQNGAYSYQLHALDLTSGTDKPGSPVQIATPMVAAVAFDPFQHLQRPGLLLLNGTLYIAFGSHADLPPFHGWIFAYDAATLQMKTFFNTTATGEGASIWQAGRGIAADDDGSLAVVTANGDYDGVSNWGESVLKLSTPDLRLLDWFTRDAWAQLNAADQDFGAAGPLLVPGTHSLVTGGKEGKLYTLDRGNMGKLETIGSRLTPNIQATIFGIFNLALMQSSTGNTVFLRGFNDALKAFPIDSAGVASNEPSAVATATHNLPYDGLAVSSNGTDASTGIVWDATPDFVYQPAPVTLHAHAVSNIATELWNSGMSPLRDGPGILSKFSNPTVANGKVYLATCSGHIAVYGMIPQSGFAVTRIVHGATGVDGPVAPGQLVAIFGTSLALSTAASSAPGGVLPTQSHGVKVLFNDVPAPIVSIAPGEIDAVVPYEIAGAASASVVVQNGSAMTAAFNVGVAESAPGLFTLDDTGAGAGAILNSDFTVNTRTSPAHPGSLIVLYGTGHGRSKGGDRSGAIVTSTSEPELPVSVTIGGEPAQVLYAGTAPGLASILQVNVLVPSDLAPNPAVPVVLTVGQASSPFGVTLAVK